MDELMMMDGTLAQYVGIYTDPVLGGSRPLKIYVVEEDRPYVAPARRFETFTPTSKHIGSLTAESLRFLIQYGTKGIVIHKDLWHKVKAADEISEYTGIENMTATKTWKNMTGNESLIMNEKKNSTLNMMGQAFVDGAKTVGAAQTNDLISSGLKKMALSMGLSEEYVNSDLADFVTKLGGPALIHYLATSQSDQIDQLLGRGASSNIQEGTKLATQKVFQDVMEPLVQFLFPLLKELASGGLATVAKADPIDAPNLDASQHDEENERVFGKTKEAVYAR